MAGKSIFYRDKEQDDTFFTLWVPFRETKAAVIVKLLL